MNVTWWQIYLVTRGDAVHTTLDAMLTVSIVFLVFLCVFFGLVCHARESDPKDEDFKRIYPKAKNGLSIFVLITLLLSFFYAMVPTSNELAAIVLLPKIADSKFITETLPTESQELFSLTKRWLEAQVEHEKKTAEKEDKQ